MASLLVFIPTLYRKAHDFYTSMRFGSVDHKPLIISEEKIAEMIKGHKNVQHKYDMGKQLRKNVIAEIRSISSDIQSLERNIKEGTILCSTISIVSSVVSVSAVLAAPFTGGGSLALAALTSVGAGVGLGAGVFDVIQKWINSSGIQAKCNQVSMLLKVIEEHTEEFHGLIKNLYRLQKSVCTPLDIDHISLSAIGLACGEAVRASILRSIPYIEESSMALLLVCTNQETVCVAVSVNSTREVIAPVVGKQATSGIAKRSSLRFIGVAAICITILMDIKKIADNTAALNQKKFSDLVTRLEEIANKMETERNNFITTYRPIVGG